MLGLKATMAVIDNSGALVAECINVLRTPSSRGLARTGDEIVVVIKKARPIAHDAPTGANVQRIRRGDVRHAVVVRTRKETTRNKHDGRVVRFDESACVLINNRKEPLGTRISGVVDSQLREKGWSKILALAGKAV